MRVEALGYKTDPGAHNVLSNEFDFLESITKSARKGDWKGTKKGDCSAIDLVWSLRSQNLVPAGRLSQVDDEIHLETSNSKWESWWKLQDENKTKSAQNPAVVFWTAPFFFGVLKKNEGGKK